MALTGKIADWSLADILQLVTAEHKSGVLTLSFSGEEIRFEFHHGGIVNARRRRSSPSGKTGNAARGRSGVRTPDAGDGGLVAFLSDTGRIKPDQVEALQTLSREHGGDEFRAAIRGKVLPPDALEEGLTEYTQELLHQVLTWPAGDYSFVARMSSMTAPELVLNTEGLLFEGMRRIDEAPHSEEAGTRPADTDEAPLVDLTPEDLEPTPRRSRVLRIASLVLLLAASVAFRSLSHRDYAAASGDATPEGSSPMTAGHDPRVAQATAFACDLFRAAHGREPASARELRQAGLLPAGYWEEVARAYVDRGPEADTRAPSAE
jgi:hypothetical protein